MRLLLVFFALAIVMMGTTVAIQAGLEDAKDDITVHNETFTPDAGNITTLANSNIRGAFYKPTVDVYDSNGKEVDPGDDYEWIAENGTVRAIVGGKLDGEPSANITYTYTTTTERQRRIADMLGYVPQAVGLALPLGALIALLAFARGGG